LLAGVAIAPLAAIRRIQLSLPTALPAEDWMPWKPIVNL
jgi:hypothetical protein